MTHMPYWLAKTSEMIAMDKWFSLAGAGDENTLRDRYHDAINRVTQVTPRQLADDPARSLESIDPVDAQDAMDHFGSDWLNFDNLNSGGDFWPQIPSWQIIIWLRQGILSGAKKALGAGGLTSQQADALFEAEQHVDPSDDRMALLPMTTIWVCTGSVSSAGFEVDAVRGPTAVELVIATPPPRLKGRLFDAAKTQIDAYWRGLHGNEPPPPPVDDVPQS